MWEAITFVSSGLALVAFILTAVAWIYKGASERTLRLIETAEEVDRGPLVRSALEVVEVDTAGLTNAQKYELAIALIRARAERFRMTATVDHPEREPPRRAAARSSWNKRWTAYVRQNAHDGYSSLINCDSLRLG